MKKSFLILLVLCISGCKKSTEAPANLLPEDKMRDILIQIHLAEAKVSILALPEDSSKVLFNDLSRDVYKKYGTDSATFKQSFSYYTNESSGKLEKIYTSVVDSLSLRESRKSLQ